MSGAQDAVDTEGRHSPGQTGSAGLADWVIDIHLVPEDTYRVIFEQAATGVAVLDLDGRFLRANGECCRILGYREEELVRRRIRDVTPGDEIPSDQQMFDDLLAGRLAHYQQERQAVPRQGGLVWIQLDVSLVRSVDGKPRFFILQARDNTERKRVEHALHASEERFRTLATYAPFGVFETSPDGRCTFVNQHWQALTGQRPADALEFGWSAVIHPDDRSDLLRSWGMAVREERGLDCEFRCRRPDGSDAWVFASVVPMRNEASEITAYLDNLVDITFRKEAEAELRRLNAQLEALATTDALTGLPNRRAMLGHLAALWAAAQRYNEPLSCLMLDIDRFKDVNDGYGHAAGDAALREIAVTLRRAARQSDICGRFGGEEFLVLCPRTELEDALAVAERIRQAIESQAIRFEVYEIAVTVSIGTACCRSQADDSQTLIAAADEQLYAAKRGGRNCTRAAYCA